MAAIEDRATDSTPGKDLQEQQPWYAITDVDKLDSPAFVIYIERVKKNIEQAIAMVGDVDRLRPHVKTHKSAEITRLMLDKGITRFKCATIAEADMLGTSGTPDVLLAYQPVGPKVQRLLNLVTRYPSTRFSCLVDSAAAASDIGRQAFEFGVEVPVYVDLNTGMNRTGIAADEKASALFEKLATLRGIKPIGLHVYDGHITEPDLGKRTIQCNESFALVWAIKNALQEKGYQNIAVVAGGSPTFPIHARREDVECSPGTFVYWDKGYQQAYPEQPFLPAALVISRIVSFPADDLVCCDLGHKAVAAENTLQRRVLFLNAADLAFVSQSEEHLVLRSSQKHSFSVGDVLYGLPFHVCPTCALYESAVVIAQGRIKAAWKTAARDRKLTF